MESSEKQAAGTASFTLAAATGMACELVLVLLALLGASNGFSFVRQGDRGIPKRGGFNHCIEHIGINCGSLRSSR